MRLTPRILAILATVFWITWALVFWAAWAQAGEIHTIGMSGGSNCAEPPRVVAEWKPPVTIQLQAVTLWNGTPPPGAQYGIFDTYTTLWGPPGRSIHFMTLDHYAPFSGIHQLTKDFSPPHTVTVLAGEPIWLEHYCAVYGGTPFPNESMAFALLWYVVVEP